MKKGFLEIDFFGNSVNAHVIPISLILPNDYQGEGRVLTRRRASGSGGATCQLRHLLKRC